MPSKFQDLKAKKGDEASRSNPIVRQNRGKSFRVKVKLISLSGVTAKSNRLGRSKKRNKDASLPITVFASFVVDNKMVEVKVKGDKKAPGKYKVERMSHIPSQPIIDAVQKNELTYWGLGPNMKSLEEATKVNSLHTVYLSTQLRSDRNAVKKGRNRGNLNGQQELKPEFININIGLKRGEEMIHLGTTTFVVRGHEVKGQMIDLPVRGGEVVGFIVPEKSSVSLQSFEKAFASNGGSSANKKLVVKKTGMFRKFGGRHSGVFCFGEDPRTFGISKSAILRIAVDVRSMDKVQPIKAIGFRSSDGNSQEKNKLEAKKLKTAQTAARTKAVSNDKESLEVNNLKTYRPATRNKTLSNDKECLLKSTKKAEGKQPVMDRVVKTGAQKKPIEELEEEEAKIGAVKKLVEELEDGTGALKKSAEDLEEKHLMKEDIEDNQPLERVAMMKGSTSMLSAAEDTTLAETGSKPRGTEITTDSINSNMSSDSLRPTSCKGDDPKAPLSIADNYKNECGENALPGETELPMQTMAIQFYNLEDFGSSDVFDVISPCSHEAIEVVTGKAVISVISSPAIDRSTVVRRLPEPDKDSAQGSTNTDGTDESEDTNLYIGQEEEGNHQMKPSRFENRILCQGSYFDLKNVDTISLDSEQVPTSISVEFDGDEQEGLDGTGDQHEDPDDIGAIYSDDMEKDSYVYDEFSDELEGDDSIESASYVSGKSVGEETIESLHAARETLMRYASRTGLSVEQLIGGESASIATSLSKNGTRTDEDDSSASDYDTSSLQSEEFTTRKFDNNNYPVGSIDDPWE